MLKVFQSKSDAQILSELQALVSIVDAYDWVDGKPRVSFSEEPSAEQVALVKGYFIQADDKELA